MTTSSHVPPVPPLRLTARGPEDLLAVVPVVLGFHPTESVVLLTFGARRQFHARIDLPRTPADTAATLEALLAPCLREQVRAVALVVYAGAGSAAAARAVAEALVPGFEAGGLRVVDAIRADGVRWFPLRPGRGDVPDTGTPYDVRSHPFSAQAVFEGRAVLSSRDAVAETLRTDADGAARVLEAATTARPVDREALGVAVAARLREGRWSDAALASVLLGLRRPAVRDAAWSTVRREEAAAHVALWSEAVRHAPAEMCAPAAAVLAYVAWLAGDGALAWCAVDRCRAHDPGSSLARLVADLLEQAVPPAALGEGG